MAQRKTPNYSAGTLPRGCRTRSDRRAPKRDGRSGPSAGVACVVSPWSSCRRSRFGRAPDFRVRTGRRTLQRRDRHHFTGASPSNFRIRWFVPNLAGTSCSRLRAPHGTDLRERIMGAHVASDSVLGRFAWCDPSGPLRAAVVRRTPARGELFLAIAACTTLDRAAFLLFGNRGGSGTGCATT